jgi:GcrA cell cycle regulator
MAKADTSEPIRATRISIYELTKKTCRWPIGEPQSPDFCYCGGQALEGLPYCGHHCRMAYPAGSPARRR